MIITYEEFCDILSSRIQTGEDFYSSLLENVINNPTRYCGLFRLSNAKTKLIQNVTQSNEIKFGDLIEELTTEYISRLGYTNYDKKLGRDMNGDELNVDQYFTDGEKVYMVEMKIRDDHDSTKKRGQYSNFRKKVNLVIEQHKNQQIEASMWFVDDGLIKNRNYYRNEMVKEKFPNCKLNLFYGNEFFSSLRNGHRAWDEFIQILTEYRIQNSSMDVEIPDFGSSKQILDALVQLSAKNWNKLMSDDPKYELLRSELFSSGNNLETAKINRRKRLK
jgi:hypothetical protein